MRRVIAVILSVSFFGFSGPHDFTLENLGLKIPYDGELLPEEWPEKKVRPSIALYTDQGSWLIGKEHLKLFFKKHNLSYQTVSAADIKSGVLINRGFQILVMPGGESWTFLKSLGEEGAEKIRQFITNGGGYMGFCAGAYYATSLREGGYATGPYGIGLLEGVAYDGTALNKAPFAEGMLAFDVLLRGFAPIYQVLLLGGPSFIYSYEESERKNIVVIAEYQTIHEPAMIYFDYGKGHVFLSGPHPEVEERYFLGFKYKDPDSEWPILRKVVDGLVF